MSEITDTKWYQEGFKKAITRMPFYYWGLFVLLLAFPSGRALFVDLKGLFLPSTLKSETVVNLSKRVQEMESNTIAVVNATTEMQKFIKNIDKIVTVHSVKIERNEKEIEKLVEK